MDLSIVPSLVTDPTVGIVARLAVALKAEAGFTNVNSNLTACSTGVEPSIEGAQLERLVGSLDAVRANLRRRGRRSATVAEGLLYGLTHPEAISCDLIWCIDQIVEVNSNEYALVLGAERRKRYACLGHVWGGVGMGDQVLTFPMASAEPTVLDT